jgi:hypothetical protein
MGPAVGHRTIIFSIGSVSKNNGASLFYKKGAGRFGSSGLCRAAGRSKHAASSIAQASYTKKGVRYGERLQIIAAGGNRR